jgi:hypothetical protein
MNETPIPTLAKRPTTGVSTRQRVEKSKTDAANSNGEIVGLEDVMSELSETSRKFVRGQKEKSVKERSVHHHRTTHNIIATTIIDYIILLLLQLLLLLTLKYY